MLIGSGACGRGVGVGVGGGGGLVSRRAVRIYTQLSAGQDSHAMSCLRGGSSTQQWLPVNVTTSRIIIFHVAWSDIPGLCILSWAPELPVLSIKGKGLAVVAVIHGCSVLSYGTGTIE